MEEYYNDPDPAETSDWLESLKGVMETEGDRKTDYLLNKLTDQARERGVNTSPGLLSPYTNTITPDKEDKIPDDSLIARNAAAFVRWNAMAMVARANRDGLGLGGHISSYASAAVLYEVGFNWFFKGPEAPDGPDLVFFQGHSAPGIYARAFVEGRLTEENLQNFRREIEGKGLSSYPHPWLMPSFWQFPTVSMGLGPITAVYQARFMKYLEAGKLKKSGKRKVWVFMGDGESDEPESLSALSLASREKLDNLIFVVNCNLQRLDGPVRGNGKIVQELEGKFRGAGWNVIKVLWGSEWDEIIRRDKKGLLLNKLTTMVDGDFQTIAARGPEYIREKIFGSDPELLELVKDKSDRELWQLSRGGHDPRKVYAAYSAAVKHEGQPTVILFKTIKGYGTGAGEASMGTHNVKKMDLDSLKAFRDRFSVPLKDDELEDLPFIRPEENSPEGLFIKSRRQVMGGPVPFRKPAEETLEIPPLEYFKGLLSDSGERELSTTMAFVRLLGLLVKHKEIGDRVVPVVPDEARTFGMEGLFRQLGIYAPSGQLYEPQDAEALMWYREDKAGKILEEGINEAGAFSSWLAAATSYANHDKYMIPFYTFYSIFGFQRIGDLAWAAGDSRARGFLMGATSGRTTLNGEGLQHQDGHSLLLASTLPTCVSYDPAFSYELAVIIQDGLNRMYVNKEDLFYYITLMNENYIQPEMPEGVEEGIIRGVYRFRKSGKGKAVVNLMGSGAIFNEVIAAADMLESGLNIAVDVWSIPGINQLHRDGIEKELRNLEYPDKEPEIPYLTSVLSDTDAPVVISTDYIRSYPEQIRRLVPNPLTILGTDGYGRSDTREALRKFFKIDRYYIVRSALASLLKQKIISKGEFSRGLEKYHIPENMVNPITN